MNDELDTLRSFGPEAAGPTDALQLRERIALMETIAQGSTRAPRRRPRLGRRGRIALGFAAALLVVVATAGATGMIPNDVQQTLGLAASHSPDSALTPQVDQAVERVSAPAAGGGTLELWTAPTAGGGTCAYLRHLDASGNPTDSGPISCAISLVGGVRLGTAIARSGSQPGGAAMSIGSGPFGDGTVQAEVDSSGSSAFGQAPTGAARVEVLDSNGAVLGDETPSDGWFLLSLSPDATAKAASLVALSASGASLVSIPVHAATPAPATGSGSN
jgi:hypothetical protein